MTRTEALDLRQKVIDGETVQAAGGITIATEQSDKLGFDWRVYSVNDIIVRKDYVEQETPTGTLENPIVYTEGTPLINNAYYLKDNKLYVWMDEWVECTV